MTEESQKKSGFRPEIQALRALVVFLIGYHYWPDIFKGGYSLLDGFFVISGFLITGIILKGVGADNKLALARFWSWRSLRILPSALFVLIVVLIATAILADANDFIQFVHQIQASALYVENWYLAIASVDYFASEINASPVQHYWSLSIEEQFYLVWPIFIAAVVYFARNKRRVLIIATAAFTLTSFILSIIITQQDQQVAYLITPTRIWEITIGGLLTLIGVGSGMPRLRALASWLGMLILLGFLFAFDSPEIFPGFIAIVPALATIMVIWGGTPDVKWSLTRLFRSRPVQWLGDHAYAIYLWHWPVLIFAIMAIDAMPSNQLKLALAALTIILSALSKRFVEDPFRYSKKLRATRPGIVIGCFALTIILLVAICLGAIQIFNKVNAERLKNSEKISQINQAKINQLPQCHGKNLNLSTTTTRRNCSRLDLIVAPTPLEIRNRDTPARNSLIEWDTRRCFPPVKKSGSLGRVCVLGDPQSDQEVALLGDSHAIHWRPALNVWGQKEKIKIVSIGRLGCSFVITKQVKSWTNQSACDRWQGALLQWLRKNPQIQTLVIANYATPGLSRSKFNNLVKDYRKTWSKIPPSVKKIVVIRDSPVAEKPLEQEPLIGLRYNRVLACIQSAIDNQQSPAQRCASKRNEVLSPDAAVVAARQGGDRQISVIDPSNYFCDQSYCYPVVAGIMVFNDSSHITPEFSTTLSAPMGAALNQAIQK